MTSSAPSCRDEATKRAEGRGATLGLTPGLSGGRGGKYWIEYDLPGGGCLAITNTTGGSPGGGTIAFEVEDLDRLMADLKAKDVSFKSDVVKGPKCRMMVSVDSEGNSIVLHQLDPPTAR